MSELQPQLAASTPQSWQNYIQQNPGPGTATDRFSRRRAGRASNLSHIVTCPCRGRPIDNPGSQVAFQAVDARNTRPPTTALRERSGRSDRHSKYWKHWKNTWNQSKFESKLCWSWIPTIFVDAVHRFCVFCDLHGWLMFNLSTDWLNAIVFSLHVLDWVPCESKTLL